MHYVRCSVSTLSGFGKERMQLGLNTLSTAQGHLKPIPQKRAKRLRIHLQDQTSPSDSNPDLVNFTPYSSRKSVYLNDTHQHTDNFGAKRFNTLVLVKPRKSLFIAYVDVNCTQWIYCYVRVPVWCLYMRLERSFRARCCHGSTLIIIIPTS